MAVFITVAAALALLILSTSKTSLVVAVASVPMGAIVYVGLGGRIRRVRLRPELGIPFLVVTAIVGGLAVTYGQAALLEALGRDPTFTGRTKIWNWAIAANETRPWLGSGFRTFWVSENTRYFAEYIWVTDEASGERSADDRGPDHAHSGYVDTYLELGLIGVGGLSLVVLSALNELRQAIRRGDMQLGFMFATVTTFLLTYAFSERSLLQHSEDLWFLFLLHYLYAAKGAVLAQPARSPHSAVSAGRLLSQQGAMTAFRRVGYS
jgi:O-antigen ligase